MGQDKYTIMYDWKQGLHNWYYDNNYSTNWLVLFLLHVIAVHIKYDIYDIEVRKAKYE